MAEDHKLDRDGILKDGVSFHEADAQAMQLYETAKQALSQHRAPILLDRDNPHHRLYVAAFDGTGNDGDNNPEHATNVHKIRKQIEALNDPQIAVGYVAGPGTQDSWAASAWDGARGHTYDERIEEMYSKFIEQAWEWKRQDPNVQISLADVGFSRGAEQATGFARLVHERGIQDPTGAKYTKNENGEITGVTYTKPPLVAPGQVAQVAGLFDPVGTGEPVNEKDRRLPASLIDGFQIKAKDEIRVDFKGTNIIDQGTNSIGRFLGVTVPGAHSDVGGSYHRNGLSNRAGNLMIDYLNALSDKPYLRKLEEPTDPRLNVVHHSHEHMLIYGAREKVDRRSPEGTVDQLVPKDQMKDVPDPYNAELRDNALNARFERQPVQIGPVIGEREPTPKQSPPTAPLPGIGTPLPPETSIPAGQPGVPEFLRTPASTTPLPGIGAPRPEAAAPQASAPSIPDHLRDFRHEGHPRHAGYERFLQALQEQPIPGVTPDQHERIAAAFTAAQGTRPFFKEVDRFYLDKEGVLWAGARPNSLISEKPRWEKIDLADTLNQTPETLASQWRERHVPESARSVAQAPAQAIDPQQLSPADLRHPDHARHGMFAQTRGLLATEYERWGLQRDPAQLDREAARVVVEARQQRMDGVAGLSLTFPPGAPPDRPMVALVEHPGGEFANRVKLDGEKLAQAPQMEQTNTQLQQVEQHLAIVQQQEMQMRQEREMTQGQGRTV